MIKQSHPLFRGTIVSTTWCKRLSELLGIISVWCPVCRCFHEHSWRMRDNARVQTHRVAHCSDDKGPFYEHGYLISVWRRSDPEWAAHVVKPGRSDYGPRDSRMACSCGCRRRQPGLRVPSRSY